MKWLIDAIKQNKKEFRKGQEVIYKNKPEAFTIIVEMIDEYHYKINCNDEIFVTHINNLI